MTTSVLKVPRELRRGGKAFDEEASIESGLQLIQLMARKFSVPDLGQASVLDMGCGCKLVQAILDHQLRIGRYVGIDVFPELIAFLQDNVTDPRFSFHVQNTHNEMYNPQGEPLSANTSLPIAEASFDIICLFSVFTHLAPHDYSAMLQLLRRFIKPGGKLIFSLIVNEVTVGGLGFIDNVNRAWNDRPGELAGFEKAFKQGLAKSGPPDFLDYDPSQPLKWAIYSRDYALRLVNDCGWKVESLNDPEAAIQHYMICSPA
jgi:SAM-dependent methyltransferase